MIVILSPAKTLDYESSLPTQKHTQPRFLDKSKELIAILKKKSKADIQKLMGVSEKIAQLNVDRYKSWKPPFTPANARQAIFAFDGAVYRGFDFESYAEKDFQTLQNTVRILSGLYGILRPLDLMQPYRLEMGTSLPNKSGKDLYAFWKDNNTASLKAECKDTLVNLASKEYFSSVDFDKLGCKVITPIFKNYNKGTYKVIGLSAKKARGLCANFIVKNNIKRPEDVKKFNAKGYKYDPKTSTDTEYVFLRKK